jgi:predicted RNase H-like HicB family nuclease
VSLPILIEVIMKFSVIVDAIRDVEIEAWNQDGKWFVAIPDAKVLVSGVSLWDAIENASIATESLLGTVVTEAMKKVWNRALVD